MTMMGHICDCMYSFIYILHVYTGIIILHVLQYIYCTGIIIHVHVIVDY